MRIGTRDDAWERMTQAVDLTVRLLGLAETLGRSESLHVLEDAYLTRAGDFVPAFGAGIYVFDPATGEVESAGARGVSDFFMSRYERAGRELDPVLRRALDAGTAVDSGQLMSDEEWRRSPLYSEVLRLHGIAHLLQSPIISDGRVVGTLNFGRHAGAGSFLPADHVVANALGRVLGTALSGVRARTGAERERDRAVAALELVHEPVVVTDLGRAERTVNAAAQLLLSRLADPDAELEDLIRLPATVGEVVVTEGSAALAGGGTCRLRARVELLPAMPGVSVCFLAVTGEHHHRVDLLLPQYGLTLRERQVATHAAAGLHDREIAERLCISTHTVKQYLKSTYRKLGVRSRVELARMALTDEPAAGGSPAGAPPP